MLPNKKGILSTVTALDPEILYGRGLVKDHLEEPELKISVEDMVC